MTPTETLIKARDIIREPEHWCQRSYARNKNGLKVPNTAPSAVRFCLSEAIYRAAGQEIRLEMLARGLLQIAYNNVPLWNDSHTHAEVMVLLNRTIERNSL